MPVLHFPLDRLQAALGKDVDEATLRERIPMLGCPVEESDGPEWSVEVFPNRPDLLSPQLLGRALRAFLDIEPGLARYPVDEPTQELVVDGSVAPVRPVIVCGAAYGLEIDEVDLKGLMELQEDLHWGLGARRRKVSVGIHDAREIQAPFTYKAVDPDAVSFVPLHGADEMTMREMTTSLEKGQDYAHLVEDHEAWPLIVDAEDQVLSFPPIINGTRTTITEATTDVFVDVTGQDERACRQVLNIVMCHLAELGARLEAVTVTRPEGQATTPDLAPTEHTCTLEQARGLLGADLAAQDAADALARMGHDATVDGDQLTAQVAAWRADVLHPVDLVEDIAIGVGYPTFQGRDPTQVTYGQALAREGLDDKARQALTGLGYLECMTLTLTSAEEQTTMIGVDEPLLEMENPETSEQAVARRRLLPSLLTLASRNTHRDLPQRLFEVGDVLEPRDQAPPSNRRLIAGLEVASDAGFTRIKSHVEALLNALGLPFQEEAATTPPYAPGRCAKLTDPETGRLLGTYGEISPEVIATFELGNPCAGFELEPVPALELETWSPAEEPRDHLELRGA